MSENKSGNNNARIDSLAEKLRGKLKNFSVMDKQGELLGEVKDLILDNNRQLNLVVSQMAIAPRSRLFLLMSKLIQKIDPPNKLVSVDINKTEIEQLPEYVTPETSGMELSEMQNDSVTPAQEAADESIIKDSEYPSAATMQTPSSELADVPDKLDEDSALDVPDKLDEDSALDVPDKLDENSALDVSDKLDENSALDVPDKLDENSALDVADKLDEDSALDVPDKLDEDSALDVADKLDENSALDFATPKALEEEVIRLLGERLVVDRSKRRVGEVIVRKEIETRMVQVTVRREKLIVEQVSPERKQLAEIDLGQGEISGVELAEPGEITTVEQLEPVSLDNGLTVSGEFKSPKIASLILNAIALERHHGCKKVRVEVVVEDAERQKTYQEWFDRCSPGSKE